MDIIKTDVLIIGAGAAGIRAALSASKAGSNVILVDMNEPFTSGSSFANISRGWGIQALIEDERKEKNLEEFFNDIMRVGLGMCDSKLVRILVEESGERVKELMDYGIKFKKDNQGRFLRAKGCFSSFNRAFVTEDIKNVIATFKKLLKPNSLKFLRGRVIDLKLADHECWGGWMLTPGNVIVKIDAKATVITTGGGSALFRNHLINDYQIGEGYALALRAKAELYNMEFIQFMIGMRKKGTPQFFPLSELRRQNIISTNGTDDLFEILISDSSLRNTAIAERQTHFPFSCRDSSYLVDNAIAMSNRDGKCVYHYGNEDESPEIAHFTHAFNGGIKIDDHAETSIPGLFAAGEAAAGPHGADRIGGCMMTATQVFGHRAGKFASERASGTESIPDNACPSELVERLKCLKPHDINDKHIDKIKTGLKDRFSEDVMLLRNDERLKSCLFSIKIAEASLNGLISARMDQYITLIDMAQVMSLVCQSALNREQSLGSHYREDFPPQNI